MRGFPFFNLILCLLLGTAVLLPVVLRATHTPPRPALAESGPDLVENTVNALVKVRFVHPPLTATLHPSGKPPLEWESRGLLLFEETVKLPFDSQRTEFSLLIRWPEGTPDTLAEVTVEPESLPSRTQNLWSSGGTADEVISFTWEGTSP
jgi:hypothetical protein